MFQRKHYEFIANVIESLDEDGRTAIAERFAEEFEYTQENFDKERFLKACNLPAEFEE